MPETGDIWACKEDGKRYEVGNVTVVSKVRQRPVAVEMDLNLLSSSGVAYALDLRWGYPATGTEDQGPIIDPVPPTPTTGDWSFVWIQPELLVAVDPVTFRTPDSYIPGTLAVFLNGQFLFPGSENGFVELGGNSFRLKEPLHPSDWLGVGYNREQP
jgi:hypothetical protein